MALLALTDPEILALRVLLGLMPPGNEPVTQDDAILFPDVPDLSRPPQDDDGVLLRLADGSGSMTTLGLIRGIFSGADLFARTAPVPTTPGTDTQRYWHLRAEQNGQPTRADLYVYDGGWGVRVTGFVLDASTSTTSPLVGLTLSATTIVRGNSVTLTATPTSGTDPYKQVEFFADGKSIGTAAGAPWQLSDTPPAAGQRVYTAVVTDDLNKQATSQPRNLQVTAPTLPVPVITFPALPAKKVGDAAYALAATSTNTDTPITYTSSNVNVATVQQSGGAWTVTPVGVGSATITASQAAGNNYAAAVNVTQAFAVSAAAGNPPSVVLEINPNSIALGGGSQLFASPASQTSTITKVEFFDGTELVGTATASPWQIVYTPDANHVGTRSMSAKATDATTAVSPASNTVLLVVNVPPATFDTSLNAATTQGFDVVFSPDTMQVLEFNKLNGLSGAVINLSIVDSSNGSISYVAYANEYGVQEKPFRFTRADGTKATGKFTKDDATTITL